jgi:hypothetical protein
MFSKGHGHVASSYKLEMKPTGTWILAATLGCASRLACAQLQVLPDQPVPCLFGSEARKITVLWHNAGDHAQAAGIRLRLYQTSSATAAPLAEKRWKEIEVLPGQTVLESAAVDFPAVNAETKFLVQWLADTNRVVGKTEVLVYPTNLLDEFKPMLGGEKMGVLDPNGMVKPSLKKSGVGFLDLGGMVLDDFSGKLAVVGPFQSRAQMREGLAQTIQRIAKMGVAVVWIQPPPEPKDEIKPSFFIVPEGKGAVIIVQPELVADFSENPKSQLNLIYFCKLALKPEPPVLPDFAPQP